MNRRRKNKKPKKKNKKRSNGYTTRESPSWTFLDPHKFMTLRYVENFTTSIATTVGSQQTMNLNSLFDPNRTGTGHQPYGYDTIATLYNRYRVISTRYKIVLGSRNDTYNLVILPVNGLIVSAVADNATFQTAAEMPRAIVRTQSAGGGAIMVFGNIDLKKLTGVRRVEYLADDRFEAAIGASPTELMTLVIGIYNPSGATISVTYTVEMWFLVDFHDPIALAGS